MTAITAVKFEDMAKALHRANAENESLRAELAALRDALKVAREVLADERYISRYSQVVSTLATIDAAMKGE